MGRLGCEGLTLRQGRVDFLGRFLGPCQGTQCPGACHDPDRDPHGGLTEDPGLLDGYGGLFNLSCKAG
jgi:hypothetical protein